jgi:hypothetical protein
MQRELLWELSSLFLVTQRRNSLEKCTCTLYRKISAGRWRASKRFYLDPNGLKLPALHRLGRN